MNKKRWIVYTFGVLFLALIVVITISVTQNHNSAESGLRGTLQQENIEVVYTKVHSARSETFPVDGYELSEDWCIANINGEEVFYITLRSSAVAEDVCQKSFDKYHDDSSKWIMTTCKNDIVVYYGDAIDIITLLNSIS